MTLNLMDIPKQGGGWFKPKENVDAVAILLEVKDFEAQRPTPNGPKDSILADISIFETQADLDNLAPSSVHEGMRIEQTVLARDLKGLVGGATIVKLAQVPPSKPGAHPAWVWRQVDGAAKQSVIAYATKREEAIQAALADAPSFE